MHALLRGSSAVEHSALNRVGAGSNPAPGPITSQGHKEVCQGATVSTAKAVE